MPKTANPETEESRASGQKEARKLIEAGKLNPTEDATAVDQLVAIASRNSN